jgi:hypothetical protein
VANQPHAVAASVNEFIGTLVEAVLIVLAVSFVALGLHSRPWRLDVRPGLVVALTIPLVLAITFLFMQLFSIDLHKISLGALIIALGLLVDDAIIAVEMMVRKMEEGMSRFEAATFAYSSTAMPMLTGTLITAAGFLPIGLAKSAAGEYTFSMFSVNAIALLVSWVVAVMFTPYLGMLLLKVRPPAAGAGAREVFDTPGFRRFRSMVTWCVEWRKSTIALTMGVVLLGLFGFQFIEKQFFPDSSRPELMVEMWMPEGTTYRANEAQVKKFEALIGRQPNVASVTSYVGTGSPRFYLPLGPDFPADERVADRRAAEGRGQPRSAAPGHRRDVQARFPRGARARQGAAERAAGAVSGAVPGGRAGHCDRARAGRPGQGHHARQPERGGRERQLERAGQGVPARARPGQAARARDHLAKRDAHRQYRPVGHADRPVPRGQQADRHRAAPAVRGARHHLGAQRHQCGHRIRQVGADLADRPRPFRVGARGGLARRGANGRSRCSRTSSTGSRGRPCRARSAPRWPRCARACRPATRSGWPAPPPTARRPKRRSRPMCRWCCSSCSPC